jgi:hypothetical protein
MIGRTRKAHNAAAFMRHHPGMLWQLGVHRLGLLDVIGRRYDYNSILLEERCSHAFLLLEVAAAAAE